MAAMSAKGPAVNNSEEAEMLACRKSIEFVMDAGFSELVIEGDNANVIRAISSLEVNQSLLGNVVDDIQQLLYTLHWVDICSTRRGGNKVAHVLAQHARNIPDDMYWIEELPPLTMETLYQNAINE